MTVKAERCSLWKIDVFVTTVITFMLEIGATQGLRWVKTPSNITKCAGETLHLTWEYVKEENEDIRQFQWRFNSSTLIAYRGVENGLHIDPKYNGRVNESGVTGILLINITAKDKGSYSLYIIIAWKDTPVIHSSWLNVIDAEEAPIPQWCTCERLPIFQEWNGGRNINIVTDGCRLEVNSSHCCIREPLNRCKDNNPQDLCRLFPGPITEIENVTPVRNNNQLSENYTQNGLFPEGSKYKDIEVNTVNTVLLIALIIIVHVILVVLIVIFICLYWRNRQFCTKECQKANIKPDGPSEQDSEQRNPMLTDCNELKLQPCSGNKGIREKGETSGSVSRLSEHADYNDFVMILKEVQYQRRILQEIITKESRHNMRIRTDLEAHSDCSDVSSDIKTRHNILWTDEETEIPGFGWSVPAETPRNNRDMVYCGNWRHVLGSSEKRRNIPNNQNINIKSRTTLYYNSDSIKEGDGQMTDADLQFFD